jgi:UDP:flavonoid glycosyltransferase YjiC (YdhE family)
LKILFFPSDIGGGFGHISRCLALAYEASERGHTCAFVLNTNKYEKKVQRQFPVFPLPAQKSYLSLKTILCRLFASYYRQPPPLFTEISDLSYQVIRDGFSSVKYIEQIITNYLNIVKRYKPDVIISDLNLLAGMLAEKAGIPLIQIIRYAFHPKTANLLWWKNRHEGMSPPYVLAVFNPLLSKMGLNSISRAEDLLRGDYYIVPSIPEIEPIPEDSNTEFVGELTVSSRNIETPTWFQELNKDLPLVYITVGGGAGPVGNRRFFQTVAEAFLEKPVQVVVSTSSKFNLKKLPGSTKNVRFFNWVPGKLLISKADLVIFHGGYGTMMEIVSCGKPSITIPFQTEQEGNGRRLEQLGIGRVIKLSKENPKRIDCNWAHGMYNLFVQKSYDLTPEELYSEAEKMLGDDKYRNNAKVLQCKIALYGGRRQAMDLIEDKML